jgi:soluble lytic murein transglycosylase
MMAPVDNMTAVGGDSGSTASSERRASSSRYLSANDRDIFGRAMSAADRGDWIGAQGLAAQGYDPIARNIITWRYLMDQNSGASFGQIDAFLRANPNWPGRNTLYIRAETAMDPLMTPSSIVAWFGDRQPASGIGMVRLGEALVATGNAPKGRDFIVRGWINYSFTQPQEIQIGMAHGDILTPDIDRRRMDSLLWREDAGSAQRQMSRVTDEVQAIARARLALKRGGVSAGQALVNNLSAYGQRDAGVQFDLARALRKAQQNNPAEVAMLRVDKNVASAYPKAWWGELNNLARSAIKDRDYRTAYALTSDTGLSSGSEFAEAEFLAGWLALRKLNNSAAAMSHFKKLEGGVSRPISRSRAHYWEGRAAEAMGDSATAYQQYQIAAQDGDTFYGQLALAKIDSTPTLHLKDTAIDPGSARADFDADPLNRAIRVLGDLGAVNLLRTYAAYAADQTPEPKHTILLAEMLSNMGFRDVAVRVAKTASYNGSPMLKYGHPVIAVPIYPGPYTAPEQAMTLALIRQETEFDPTAISGPGAAGLMQLMPGSAKIAAQQAGLPYKQYALTTDTTYNMQLGMTEFSAHVNKWGGSLIMAAAGYNAGDGNVSKWTNDYGDPKSPTVDPIDWIESIPFTETRNYVMRVMENFEVYRNRLAGGDQPLRIMADVYRPRDPEIRIVSYTPPAPPKAADDEPKKKPRR